MLTHTTGFPNWRKGGGRSGNPLVEMMKDDRSAAHSLGRRSIEAMLAPQKKVSDALYCGLGWVLVPVSTRHRVCHGGTNGTGFRCWSEFYPEQGTGIVIMTKSR